jgi:hypothetical protein
MAHKKHKPKTPKKRYGEINVTLKRKKHMPISQRNRMINRLNRRKQRIYRAHPQGLTPALYEKVEGINRILRKL